MSARVEDLSKPLGEGIIGETGVISPIEKLAIDLGRENIHCIGIPLGGTFGMVQQPNPTTGELEWVSKLPGAFDSDALRTFNTRIVEYDPRNLYLDMIEPQPPNPAEYHALVSRKSGAALSPLRLSRLSLPDIARERRLYESLIYPLDLGTGDHALELIATDRQGSQHYADLLLQELVSGKYPRGVRLDSSELVDEHSFAVFSAVNCGVVFPKILETAERIAGGIERTERGMTKDGVRKLERAFQGLTIFISMGSDQKRIAHAFYNTLAHLTGLTFVIISSNSSYGVLGGDAEVNLNAISTVAKAIDGNRLPRGVAYDVGDGLVSTDLLEKMKPEASTLQSAVLAADGKYYGSTFLAHHAKPMDQLDKESWYFDRTEPRIPDLLLYLSIDLHNFGDFIDEYFDLIPTAYNASGLAELLNSVAHVSVDNIPDKLPKGTKFIMLEGPGRANAPAYTIKAVRNAANQLEARTNGSVKPIFIVASECPFPYATEEYGASIVGTLKQKQEIAERVVNAKSLPAYMVRSIIALNIYKTKFLSDFGFPEDRDQLERLDAKQIQNWIDEYINAHKLPK